MATKKIKIENLDSEESEQPEIIKIESKNKIYESENETKKLIQESEPIKENTNQPKPGLISSDAPKIFGSSFASVSFATHPIQSIFDEPSKLEADQKNESDTNSDQVSSSEYEETEKEEEIEKDNQTEISHVTISTGEEGEETMMSAKVKVYVFQKETKEWKERGVGTLKVNRDIDSGKKYRVIVRHEIVKKILLNSLLFKGMIVSRNGMTLGGKCIQMGVLEEDGKEIRTILIKFANEKLAEDFWNIVQKEIN